MKIPEGDPCKEPEIYYVTSEDVMRGSLAIYDIGDAPLGENVTLKDFDALFFNNGSLAEDFETAGILMKLVEEGRRIVILCNPLDFDALHGE